jgi:hypothetical protein
MPAEDALTLEHCLAAQSWHTLYALSRANAIAFHGQWTQPEAVAALATAFRERSLVPVLDALSSEARAALRALLHAGGRLAQAEFIYRFGEYRPYRPWREDAPDAPWTQPRSPTEQLLYRGLIFPLNVGTAERPVHVFALPTEYREPLRELLDVDMQAIPLAQVVEPTLLQHLFAFLSYLNRAAVKPRHPGC